MQPMTSVSLVPVHRQPPRRRQRARSSPARKPMSNPPRVALRIASLSIVALAGLAAFALPSRAGDYQLTVLHVSDLLSRLEPVTEAGATCTESEAQRCYGGAARLAARIKAERAADGNVVVVNAGNALTGSAFYDQYKE